MDIRTSWEIASKKNALSINPTISDERDDYDDDDDDEFDELDEIMNTSKIGDDQAVSAKPTEEVDGPSEEKLSEIDQTAKELFKEKEELLNLHMTSIHEHASLLTEEGDLIGSVQNEDGYNIDQYASRLEKTRDRKTDLIHSLHDRLGSFWELLKKEEGLSGVH